MMVSVIEFDVVGAYFPCYAKSFFAQCNEIALARQDRPPLLIGDINTRGNHADLTPGGVPFACATEFGALGTPAYGDHNTGQTHEFTWSTTKNDFRN